MRVRATSLGMLFLTMALSTAATAQPAGVAAWTAAHEKAIVDELRGLVSLPNVAGNDADMRKNADRLQALFTARKFKVETGFKAMAAEIQRKNAERIGAESPN